PDPSGFKGRRRRGPGRVPGGGAGAAGSERRGYPRPGPNAGRPVADGAGEGARGAQPAVPGPGAGRGAAAWRGRMSRRHWDLPWEDYLATLKPHERPVLPGSPATPDHTTPWRLA